MSFLLEQYKEGELRRQMPLATWWPLRKRLQLAARWARSPVLDAGAGTGWLTFHLTAWGHEVTAIDYSERALRDFRANAAALGQEVAIARADVSSLPYSDGQFASLFCVSVLPYVPDLDAALGELERVLRPGGIAVLGCLNAHGAYAFLNDRDPRSLFRRNRVRDDIRQDVEHFHPPRWWVRELGQRFELVRVMPLEILSPLIARVVGYDAHPLLTHADVWLAGRLPKTLASEVIYVVRKPQTNGAPRPRTNGFAGSARPRTAAAPDRALTPPDA